MKRALFLLCFLSATAFAVPVSKLEGKLTHLSSYFTDQKIYRHHEYMLHLNETTYLSDQLQAPVEIRARVNAARKEEEAYYDIRQAYLDWLFDRFRAKVGLQKFDWVESLFPYSQDLLVPIDRRFGGFGDVSDIVEPVVGIFANQKLGLGSLEVGVVPLPRSDRLSLTDNGYGYAKTVQAMTGFPNTQLVNNPIPQNLGETEVGARYVMEFSGIDVSLLGYYGHQRLPAYSGTLLNPTTLQLDLLYPRIFTVGGSASYALESWVFRALIFAEPNREGLSTKETRFLAGVGVDKIMTHNLKFYSEFWGTKFGRNTYVANFRMTFDPLSNLGFKVDASLAGPEYSHLIQPEFHYDGLSFLRMKMGWVWVSGTDPRSHYYSLRESSRVYWMAQYLFRLT